MGAEATGPPGAWRTRELHLSRYKPFFETKNIRFGFLAVIDYTSNHRSLEPFSSSLVPPILPSTMGRVRVNRSYSKQLLSIPRYYPQILPYYH